MVSDVGLRTLEQLAEQQSISQRFQGDAWPADQESIFQEIRNLGRTRFHVYKDSINSQSVKEPWKRQNTARAEWLVQQARRLQRANESTWRMRIENAIVERFSVEVACMTCKNRLWRSEIESKPNEPGHIWERLDKHRLKRGPCTCPVEARPQDRYETGMSRLFEDRVEESFLYHDPAGHAYKQRPDRIIGLRETNNVRNFLDQPARFLADGNVHKVRDVVRISPCKRKSNPLLFPFLVIEAKSDSAPFSFTDIQTQTSLPIKSLLDLQNDLQAHRPNDKGRPKPLIWFLAYRGSDWKVYGCYLSPNKKTRVTYNIHYLQGGDITTKDGALQLLLLFDYIMDWARDIFRPTIIAQLSSLATGRDFDEVSLGPDSDILSLRRIVSGWMSHTASTVAREEVIHADDAELDHVGDEGIEVPINVLNSKFGLVRALETVDFQLTGLRITEGNVESLLALSDGPDKYWAYSRQRNFSRCARRLLNELTRWDETLVVLGADLNHIESAWTNQGCFRPDPFDEGPGAEFYTIFEYRCFINVSGAVVRELSYLAISESAFMVLRKRAAFQMKHTGLEQFSKTLRHCSSTTIAEAVECLRSGSPWQVLLSAISSTLISLCPEPERKRSDILLPVTSLGFGFPQLPRVGSFIEVYITLAAQEHRTYRMPGYPFENGGKRFKRQIEALDAQTANRSFRRVFECKSRIENAAHSFVDCARCKDSNQDLFALRNWDQERVPSPTAYGAILVASLDEETGATKKRQNHHDITIYVFESSSWLSDKTSLATVLEDLAQSDMIYHTIRHEPITKDREIRSVLWNLPVPYRESRKNVRLDVARWVHELKGSQSIVLDKPRSYMFPWVREQILLFYLRSGVALEDAVEKLIDFRNAQQEKEIAKTPEHERAAVRESAAESVKLGDFWNLVGFSGWSEKSPSDGNMMYPSRLHLRVCS